MNTVIGPDISFYQDEPKTAEGVNFNLMKTAADFVIIRAGQNVWVDPKFQLHWTEAKRVGLPRGCYWFYDSRVSPKQQAQAWVNALGDDMGELPLFADFEEAYNGKYKGWKNWYDFLEWTKTFARNKEVGIYTAYFYWQSNGPNPSTDRKNLAYFRNYPLWIANYGVDKPYVPQPWGADEWLFWQFTNIGNGRAYGAESQGIDLNYFNGDITAFQQRFTQPDSTPTPTPTPTTPTPTPAPQTPIPEPEPEPVIIDPINTLYRVIPRALNMRSGPSTANEIVEQIAMDSVVMGINITRDKKWIQLQTTKGKVGWSYNAYLEAIDGVQLTNPLKVNLMDGVLFIREVLSKPRKMVANILFIDLHSDQIKFLVTPPANKNEPLLYPRTTSQFMNEFNCQIAVNGDGFSFPTDAPPCPSGDRPAKPNGFAASQGTVYSPAVKGQPTLYISKKNEFRFNNPPEEVYNAVSGSHILLKKGKVEESLAKDNNLEPRTALGVSMNGRWLTLITIDGRQSEYSEGITLTELANILLKYGAYEAINLDGGGSSTMVVAGANGAPHILNTPIETQPGTQRAVANHLGIQFKVK